VDSTKFPVDVSYAGTVVVSVDVSNADNVVVVSETDPRRNNQMNFAFIVQIFEKYLAYML
jgi:hypothetical protein